jgi:hypothetical protein
MTTRREVIYIDDLDKRKGRETPVGPGGEHMKLTLDGMTVELDLTAKHAAALRSAFRKYLDAGKVVAPNGTRPRGKA